MATRYDRQLRLWTVDGQQSLADAHVVVLGATATAAELLKNLVLPGIGFFTIVDDHVVDDEAMGNNFFLTTNDYKARRPVAEAMLCHLCELNPQTVGAACVESCAAWVETFLTLAATASRAAADLCCSGQRAPTLIVATTRVPPASLRRLAGCLKTWGRAAPPLVFVQTSGFAGVIHVQGGERFIIHTETKEGTRVADLRVFTPFPELQRWFAEHDPGDEKFLRDNIEERSHIPWIAILYHALQRLRRERNAPEFLPSSREDYDALRQVVSTFIRHQNPLQGAFMEALDKCRTVLNRSLVFPENLKEILQDPRAHVLPFEKDNVSDRNGSLFVWSVVHGIRRFIEEHGGVLPFCGYVPDFTTTTQWYRELRAIYKRKMKEDSAIVCSYAMEALENCCENSAKGFSFVDNAELAALTTSFIQNIWTLKLVRFYPNLDELSTDSLRWQRFGQYFFECCTNDERFTVELYAALLASRCFEERHGRPPGHATDEDAGAEATWISDAKELLGIIEQAWQGFESAGDIPLRACMEVARCGAGEPACTACVVGAAAAQECIKLVQHRRVPINRPLVFDGYRSCFWILPSLCEIDVV